MHCSTIALHYFALTSTSDAVSSSFVPRFQRSGYSSLLFASVRVPVCSDLILSDSLCTRLIGFCLVIGVMMGVGCEAPNLRSILWILRMGLVPASFLHVSAYTTLKVSPLPCSGVMIYSKCPLIIPGRRCRLPGWHWVILSPLFVQKASGEQASN